VAAAVSTLVVVAIVADMAAVITVTAAVAASFRARWPVP
jgi:hypothetical protein